MRVEVENGLSKHLNLDVTIGGLELTLLPRPRVSGSHSGDAEFPNRPELPPFSRHRITSK
jgi:hypothetical protein